ncbi:hypothetical protein AArcSl_2860 [Halalkaliarchaeum desulfuricum]|uniref:DUF7527 domain-containing protein n=1 Tax=Halalkaliarchaeum desulfuricum TaxID=2055893 RepID=A0A343TN03_9EURY|nr:hypothetical protein [Halalkaliarchaeum desulfuricum]AUX10475.1 hypothetical protein AArcSl_2860 [Halalkaliarchaeum desulfuricum]
MKPERTERMTEWETRPFDGGYDGLRSLVDRGFSGAVTEGAAWAVLVNGRIVGVYGGDLSAFEDADGTAYVAPDPSLALLFAMQEKSGESRAQYYTEETPISTVDETLSEGGFTGYVELSENVLSGDYYVVYSGGKSTGVAFVGNNETLYTGEEAFERADDEVGIYEVYDVNLDIVELPEPAEPEESTAVSDSQSKSVEGSRSEDATTGDTSPDQATADETDPGEPESVERVGSDSGPSSAESKKEVEREDDEAAEREDDEATEREDDEAADQDADAEIVVDAGSDAGTDATSTESVEGGASPDESDGAEPPRQPNSPERRSRSETDRSGTDGADGVFSEEAAWRQAQTIPALDPEETARLRDETGPGRSPQDRSGRRNAVERRSGRSSREREEVEPTRDAAGRRSGDGSRAASGTADPQATDEATDALKSRIEELEAALEEERNRKEALEERREELTTERDRFRERASKLEDRVEELETEIERLRDELSATAGDVPEGDRTMEPEAAISGTNLFVRYESKGKPTLDAVHAGEATREELSSNLKLEHHTTFEEEDLLVDGVAYREFLRDTVEYTFCRWVVQQLPFEIRETGNVDRLRDLYDAIPEIDRVEFDGTVAVSSTGEDGQRENEAFEFDVVFRDRMGDPLFVANLNDSREPTTQPMVDTLVSDAVSVAGKHDGLAAALSVTASFFDPGALDAVADATGGGLLNRSKRASFVKLSRKNGFHLCLVETREGGFHLNVPEL